MTDNNLNNIYRHQTFYLATEQDEERTFGGTRLRAVGRLPNLVRLTVKWDPITGGQWTTCASCDPVVIGSLGV